MADELRMTLAEVLRKAGVEEADFLSEGVRVLAQELMELELAEHVGAEHHERTPDRSGYRNGYRERPWDTRVGTIELQVPPSARRQLLSEPARTEATCREGTGSRGARGVRPGHQHQARR